MLRGYVFGYGSLVADALPLSLSVGDAVAPVWGQLHGHRRSWTVAMRNRERVNDPKHVVEQATGRRPDVWVTYVTLDADPAATVNGVAVPVDADRLAVFDAREVNYERIEVGAAFVADRGEAWPPPVPADVAPLPVWTYVASAAGRSRYEDGRRQGRAVVRGAYRERVEAAFRTRGDGAWRAYQASTTPPAVPTVDGLRLVRVPPRGGGAAPTGS